MSITVSGVLIGIVFGIALGCFQLYALWHMVSNPAYRWLWFIGKMLAYVAVFLLMALWSVAIWPAVRVQRYFCCSQGLPSYSPRQRGVN